MPNVYLHKAFHVMATKGGSGILSGVSSPQSVLQRVEGLTLIARDDGRHRGLSPCGKCVFNREF